MIPNFPAKQKDYFVNGIRPDSNDNYQIDAYLTSEEFNALKDNPTSAVPGMTYFDTELGREGFCYLKNNQKFFVELATGGGGEGGTSDYRLLTNKPSINSIELAGNKTAAELGLATSQTLANKANKIYVANEWAYTLENIEDVPVADGDAFQIVTENDAVPELILYVSQVNNVNLWAVSPPNGSAELYLTGVTATKVSGAGTSDTLTVSVVSSPQYKDLSDVQSDLLMETSERTSADSAIMQKFIDYRTAADQNGIDNAIKADKVSKPAFTSPTVNPNGFVLLWMQMLDGADAVNISYGAYQPTTGQFTQGVVAIPFADPSKAGILTKEQALSLEQYGTRLANLEAGAVGNTFVDTYADLLAIDTSGGEWINNRPVLVRADEQHDGHSTIYNYLPISTDPTKTANGFVFGIVVQEVPYGIATSSILGLVLSSAADGKGYVEPGTGVVSVNGWDTLKAAVTALQTAMTQQNTYNQNHKHTGGSDGAVLANYLNYVEFATQDEAIADMSGKFAIAPQA